MKMTRRHFLQMAGSLSAVCVLKSAPNIERLIQSEPSDTTRYELGLFIWDSDEWQRVGRLKNFVLSGRQHLLDISTAADEKPRYRILPKTPNEMHVIIDGFPHGAAYNAFESGDEVLMRINLLKLNFRNFEFKARVWSLQHNFYQYEPATTELQLRLESSVVEI